METVKEIIYRDNSRITEIVADGEYKGVRYICVNRGIHPCAYVICTPEFIRKHLTTFGDIDCITVHGGVTFTGNVSELKGLEAYSGTCFGWDYGHFNDWAGYNSNEENIMFERKKWTTQELIEECEDAIEQYLEVMEEDEEEMAQEDIALTKEILTNLGFTQAFPCDDSALHMFGKIDGKKWRIYIDLQTPGLTYARNETSHRKYEGSILTLEELKNVVDLCKLPVEV